MLCPIDRSFSQSGSEGKVTIKHLQSTQHGEKWTNGKYSKTGVLILSPITSVMTNYWYVVSPGAGGGRCDEEQHRQGPREGQQAQ